MENQVINFGKYHGFTYSQLISSDVNYCKWLLSLKHTNELNQDLITYLKLKEPEINEIIHQRRLKYANRTM